MRITFIYPDVSPITQTFMQGIGYLSSVLKNVGHRTSLIHVRALPQQDKFIEDVKKSQPDLIGFSATTNMFPLVIEWSKWIKDTIDIPIICGGKHVTLVPEESIQISSIDMLCIGEGEEALLELCDNLERNKDYRYIKNIWVKINSKIFRNQPRPLNENLDSLPFPDRTVFDYPNLACSKNNLGLFMASRGCPYNCYYCCNQALRQIYKGRYVRFRSVDNLLKEMHQVISTYPFIKIIAFDDDIVPIYKDWFREFIAKYKKEINMPFYMNVRADLLDEEVADLLKEGGCQHVRFGIESGNEYISNKILNRKLTNNQISNAFRLCKERKLRTHSYNIIGIPFEDMGCILDTIKLNASIGTDSCSVFVFYPYPKTRLYDICLEKGMLTGKVLVDYFQESIISHDKLTKEEIEFAKNYFVIFVKLHSIVNHLQKRLSKPIEKYLDNLFLTGPYRYKAVKRLIYKIYYIKNYIKKLPIIYNILKKIKAHLKK